MSSPAALPVTLKRLATAGVAIVLLWQFSEVLLLAFASVLVAIMLRAIAVLFQKVLPISAHWALFLACLAILLVAATFFTLLGAQFIAESSRLGRELPKLLSEVGNGLGVQHLDQHVLSWVQRLSSQDGIMGRITATTSLVVSGAASTLLVVVAGVYLAASPAMYRNGVIRLLPAHLRDEAQGFAETCRRALEFWLAGQLAAMVAVGLLFAIGLAALGVPSALALGFIAGIAEFVPYAGPLLGAIPALLIALSMGDRTVLWVLCLYAAIQGLEGNVITPLIQRRAVDLAPVLTLFAIVAIAGLFGVLGLLLATPLTVVGYIAVKQFYVRETLNEKTSIPGERR